MLRYFVAWNLWVAAVFALVLGQGYARRSPDYYTVFGVGWIEPAFFWCVAMAGLAVATVCFVAWRRSSPAVTRDHEPRPECRGFEVITQAQGGAAAA